MNARLAINTAALVLATIVIAVLVGRSVPRVSFDAAESQGRAVSQASAPAGGGGPLQHAFSGIVEAHSLDALAARQHVDSRVNAISKLAARQGGRVTLGESRYVRPKSADEGPRQSAAGIWIIQQVDIELPDSANREWLEAELARLSLVPRG
jgi:hypothetical protein